MNHIIDHFQAGWKPNDEQRHLLLSTESNFHEADVIGLEGPTATGKTAVKMAIASWVRSQGLGVVLTNPTKVLVNQDEASYPDFPTLKSAWDMPCAIYGSAGKAKQRLKRQWKGHLSECHGCSTYEANRLEAKSGDAVLCNAYTYMAHRLYKNVLVMDEGHNTVDMLKSLHTKTWWKTDELRWPAAMWSRDDIAQWVSELPEGFMLQQKLRPLLKEATTRAPRFSITRTVAPLRGRLTECIKMVPIDMRGEAPLLWPNSVKKIIFLSATMNQKDLDTMGLGQRRCVIVPSGSPIPAKNRPIIPVCATSMSFSAPAAKLDKLADFVIDRLNHHQGEKGIIHLPYALAQDLKKVIDCDRLIFHTKESKARSFRRYMKSETDSVLVCSGMHEGIDLVDDAGRGQIIGKIPWPSLGDPAVAAWAERDGAAYVWATLKEVIQACGRICRTPTDFGVTYIYDSSFRKLLKKAEEDDLVPEWWSEALVEQSTLNQSIKEKKHG